MLQETAPTGEKSWQLQAKGPMLYLYAADYERVDVSIPELTIEFYFSRKHREIMERVGIADTLRQVAQYATNTIGPLRFAQDGKLKLMQVSAYLGGGYAGDGMSVMGESSFVEEGLRDPLRGASGQEVMAHEILHQWWGLGLMFAEGTDPEWSAEGFTVYSTYRLMKEKYGEDYARKFYVEMWRAEAEKLERDFYHRHPEYLDKLPQQYVDTIRSHQYSTMTYCVMPLKILKAAELLGGEEKMDEVMRGLFEKGHESMQPLTYDAFLEACDLKKEQLAL